MLIANNFIQDKYTTNVIKGIALIFMFVHHFFTFPDWYIDGISYPYLTGFAGFFCSPFKLCVPIFAFLTGYFYYFSKTKTYRYSLRKCIDLWIHYLVVFIIFYIPFAILNPEEISVVKIIAEASTVYLSLMNFCWYVSFYFLSMLLLPAFSKTADKNPLVAFSAAVVFPFILTILVAPIRFPGITGLIADRLCSLEWFPCIASGYLFAQLNLFDSFSESISMLKCKNKRLVFCLFILFPFLARKEVTGYDFLLAPLFIFGLVNLINSAKNKQCFSPIAAIGKYSLIMWFVHCIFFNPLAEYTQAFLYLPREPILVLVWGLLICFAIAYVLNFPIQFLISLKKQIAEKIFVKEKVL